MSKFAQRRWKMEIVTVENKSLFSVEELEARFELEAIPTAIGSEILPDWTCKCEITV
jgi:hypothetical protein